MVIPPTISYSEQYFSTSLLHAAFLYCALIAFSSSSEVVHLLTLTPGIQAHSPERHSGSSLHFAQPFLGLGSCPLEELGVKYLKPSNKFLPLSDELVLANSSTVVFEEAIS